ncbi:MAG: tRNA lysidine(34) synthetase TilS [Rubrivivax sp.]|nr:tRNA lysidine(34) synthetase TilS [Rubrivivax sp.]MDH5339683.1 tRNA lysidine(34) synthetase TilS [Rubrivivax sp.]
MAVAVSGGRDSTALLHCTARAARQAGVEVHALHVHHGLQPAADAWLAQLSDQCRRWARSGLPLTLHSQRLEGRPGPGDSVEAWARRERYAALAAMARSAGCGAVLLAHHRRDQAETVLLQLLRGSGARGLSAMPQATDRDGVRWMRPWLNQPRRAIEAYLARHRLRWAEDASNAETRFLRNRLRAAVWPVIEASIDGAEVALAGAANRAAEEAACLHALAQLDAAACVADDGSLRVEAWSQLVAPRRANLLRHQLAIWCGRGVPDTLVSRLGHELGPPSSVGRWPAPGGELRLYRGHLTYATLAQIGVGDADEVLIDLGRPGRYALPAGRGALVVTAARTGGIAPSMLRAVVVGVRRAGDRFLAQASGVPRCLKKQFQAAGVPAWARVGPVLRTAGGSLVFVAGLGIDARAVAAPGEAQLKLRWVPPRVAVAGNALHRLRK